MSALSHFAAQNVFLARLLIILLSLLLLGLGLLLGLLLYGDLNPNPYLWLLAGLSLMTVALSLRLLYGRKSKKVTRTQSQRLMVLGFLASACLPVSLGIFLGESVQSGNSHDATLSHHVHRIIQRSSAPQASEARPQIRHRIKRWLTKKVAPLIRRQSGQEDIGERGWWYVLVILGMIAAEIGLAHLACGFICSGPVFLGYLILFGGGFLVFLLGGYAYAAIFKFRHREQRRNLIWAHALVLTGLCSGAVFIAGAVPLILTVIIGIIFMIMGYKLKRKKAAGDDGSGTEKEVGKARL
ncbi:MAG: hypothetical protein AAFR61_28990 [Bacteroidota bacterium]